MVSRVVIDFIANTGAMKAGVESVIGSFSRVEAATKKLRQVITGVGIGIGSGLVAAGMKAATFERDMQNVNSIVQDTDKVFARTSDSVLALATKLPQSVNDLAKGAYVVASAGFTEPTQMIDILKQSSKAASAGLTTVDTAANAVVTSMNAYGGAAGDAARVSDLLFKTVEVGQVSFEQLAVNLGDFIGIANASGASLSETLSAYASITLATGQASRSATSVQGIMRAGIKPSEAMTAALEQMGVASWKSGVQTFGLQGILQKLNDQVGGSEVAMAQLFQDTEGLSGVLALVGPNASKAEANLAKFTDEASINGATQKALNQQSKSFIYQITQMKTAFGSVAAEIGQRLLPVMKLFTGGFLAAFHGLPKPVKDLLVILAALTAILMTVGLSALTLYGNIKLVQTGLALLTKTQVGTYFLGMVRSSAAAQGAMVMLTRATGMTAVALKGAAMGAAVAAAAFLAIGPAVSVINNMLNPQNIDAMTQALLEMGDTGTSTGTRLEAKFGANLAGINRDMAAITARGRNGWTEAFNPKGLSGAVSRIDELDKGLAQLVTSGNIDLAKKEFAFLEKGMVDAGYSAAEIRQGFNDYTKAIAQNDMAARAAGDGQHKVEGAIDSAGEAIKKAKEETDAYKESMKGLQEVSSSFLGLGVIMGKVEEKHQKTYDTAKKAMEAKERETQRIKENAAAQNDMAKAQDKVNRLQNNQAVPGSKGYQELKDAQQEVAEAAGKMKSAQKEVNDEYKKTPPTLREITAMYKEQIAGYKNFNANLHILAKRGAPVEVVRELQKMGPEGVEIAKQLASATPEEFEKVKGVLQEKVKLEGEAWQKELDTQLVAAAAIAKRGAHNTLEAILAEMRLIAPGIQAQIPEVMAAMNALGIAITPANLGNTTNQAPGTTDPSGRQVVGKDAPSYLSPDKYAFSNQSSGGNQIDQMPGTTAPDGRKVVSKDAPSYLNPKQYVWSTLADSGAQIRPGLNLVENKTKVPEWVLTAGQMQGLKPATSRPANVGGTTTSSSTTYQFGDIYAQDLTGAMRQADQKRRLGALVG